jgi:hypothetical protein
MYKVSLNEAVVVIIKTFTICRDGLQAKMNKLGIYIMHSRNASVACIVEFTFCIGS